MAMPAHALNPPLQGEEEDPLTVTVDRFGELHLKIQDAVKEYERLKKLVAALAQEQGDEGPVVLKGARYAVEFSAFASQEKCAVSAEEFVGQTGLWQAVSVSAAQARPLLPVALRLALFRQERGSRRLVRVFPAA